MSFKQLVDRVHLYSGFSLEESKEALEIMVENIAVRLDEADRKAFASQLPDVLSDIALSVYPSVENSSGDILKQFMIYENVEESVAKKSMQVAWEAIKDSVNEHQLTLIRANLFNNISKILA